MRWWRTWSSRRQLLDASAFQEWEREQGRKREEEEEEEEGNPKALRQTLHTAPRNELVRVREGGRDVTSEFESLA